MENVEDQEPAEEMTEGANDPYGENDLRKKVQVATRVARGAGEFKSTAFEVTYKHLLRPESSTGARPVNGNGNGSHTSPAGDAKPARRSTPRRAPKAHPNSLERIKPITNADPEIVSEYAAKISKLTPKHQIYALLAFARDHFGFDTGLIKSEIRHVANDKFRLGITEKTLSNRLSDAAISDLGRTTREDGETLYKLMRPGDEVLKKAMGSAEPEAVALAAA